MAFTKVQNSMINAMSADKLTGALPAIDGSSLTGIDSGGTPMWEHIETVTTADTQGTYSFTGPIMNYNTWHDFKIIFQGFHTYSPATNRTLYMQFGFGAVPTWKTSGYYNSLFWMSANSGHTQQKVWNTNASHYHINLLSYSGAGMGMNGTIDIWGKSDYAGFNYWGANNLYSQSGFPGWAQAGGQVACSGGLLSNGRFSWQDNASFWNTGKMSLYGRTKQ